MKKNDVSFLHKSYNMYSMKNSSHNYSRQLSTEKSLACLVTFPSIKFDSFVSGWVRPALISTDDRDIQCFHCSNHLTRSNPLIGGVVICVLW